MIIANYRTQTDLPEDAAHSVTGPLFLNWTTRWDSVSFDAEHMRWMDNLAEEIEPLMTGCYVNETDFSAPSALGKKMFFRGKTGNVWRRSGHAMTRRDCFRCLPLRI